MAAVSSHSRYITLAEMARRLGVGYESLRQSARDGQLPAPVKIGRRLFYSVSEAAALFPELRQSGQPN